MRLNIGGGGCGPIGDDWITVDKTEGREAFPLAYEDESMDEVYASHILEHFPWRQTRDVLKEWVRVLKPGGRIRIAVPDDRKCCEMRARGAEIHMGGKPIPWDAIVYGGQHEPTNFHKALFDESGLTYEMLEAGLVGIRPWESTEDDCARLDFSLNLEGTKPRNDLYDEAGRLTVPTTMVMSTGRLGFTDTIAAITKVIADLQISYELHSGVFWGQKLTRAMQSAKAKGAEWIVTVDYDTLFDVSTFRKMAAIFDAHPELDALAPLQMKRDMKSVLFGKYESDEKLACELCPVESAHFGLTFIRTRALDKMPKPWFEAKPNEDGDWGAGRRDEDMVFWDKWRACGNTLAVAPWVPIGHLELMAAWPDREFKPVYQMPGDFFKTGAPKEAREI